MKYGISNLSIIPVRKDSYEQSEMVTQILFGEHFEIIEEKGNWYYICIAFDKYEGWIDKKLCKIITESTYKKLENKLQVVTTEITNNVYLSNNQTPNRIIIGSTLPFFEKKSNKFNIEEEKYRFDGIIKNYKKGEIRNNIKEIATNFINTPYLWGGKSPFGIDCSGLVQIIFKVVEIQLPRDANYQVNCGKAVNFIEEAQTGDLAFFDNNEGNIIHVGIICQQNKLFIVQEK